MKRSMLLVGLFQLVVTLVLAAPLVAQQSTYTIHVPFRFHVYSRELPAGVYRIGVVGPGTVQVHGVDSIADAMFVASYRNGPVHGPENAELVFHRYGKQYFLSQVWFAGGDQGYELTVSNTEREVAQQTPSTEMVLRAAK